jgi:hypothetical protein
MATVGLAFHCNPPCPVLSSSAFDNRIVPSAGRKESLRDPTFPAFLVTQGTKEEPGKCGVPVFHLDASRGRYKEG